MTPKNNGTLMKDIIGALTAFLLAAVIWIWNAAGVVKDVKANESLTLENKKNIKETKKELITKIDANSISINKIQTDFIGVQKDIYRLNEKMGELSTEQQMMRYEQRKSFKEILDRLPE